MIEETLLSSVKTGTSLSAYMELPKTMPDEFIVIERMGETRTNFVTEGSFAFYCFAKSLFRAATVANLVKATVDAMPNSVAAVSGTSLESTMLDNHQDINRYCYRVAYDVNYYE